MLANVKSYIRSLKHAYFIIIFNCILFVLKIHILGLSTYHQLVLVACTHNLKIIGTLVNYKFHHSLGHNLVVSLLFCLALPRIRFKEVLLPYGSNSLCSISILIIANLNKAKANARWLVFTWIHLYHTWSTSPMDHANWEHHGWSTQMAYGLRFVTNVHLMLVNIIIPCLIPNVHLMSALKVAFSLIY